MSQLVAPLVLVLVLAGCATPAQRAGVGSSSAPLDAPPQQVLAELPRIYRELGLPVARVRDAHLEIQSGNFAAPTLAQHQFRSENYRCGLPMRVVRGTSMYEHATVVTTLERDRDGRTTRVRTRLSAERVATFPDGSSERQTCLSTGELELRIERMIQEHFRLS